MEISVKITREENAAHYGVSVGDVMRISLEDYVAGVVASEIGNAAIEAARAQAVAARTFSWPYYHAGKTITDDSSKHQAFRAARIDPEKYPRAIQAARDTAGQVMRYQGSVIKTCSYSASNGGRTVSSEERWGGARPWLIAQDDPWDAAAGSGRTGHGVGMSQRGAKYAASIGKGYREILAFYYPGTDIWTEGKSIMNDKARQTVELAVGQLGSPYVYGTWGSPCKPALRLKYAGYNPAHKNSIYKACQVLSGKKENCAGCKYNGRLAFDCRGFTHWILEQVGIDIAGGGATSQYNTASNWVLRGTIDKMPDLPCCVFKANGNKMEHTGYHIGGGRIIHCSVGVQEGKVTDKGWTHFAVPVGLYTAEELAAAGVVTYIDCDNPNESEGEPMYQAKVTCPGAFLNMRSAKSKTASVVKRLNKGTIVDVLNDSDLDWWYVRQGGVSGYAMTHSGTQVYLMPIGDAAEEPTDGVSTEGGDTVSVSRKELQTIHDMIGRMLGVAT